VRIWLLASAVAGTLLAAPLGAQQAPAADTRPSFSDFLDGIRRDALARGIRAETIDRALAGVEEPQASVIDRDRSQAEMVLPLDQYVREHLTGKVLRRAREQFTHHRKLLEEVSRRYGVASRMIVAVWGIESNFGRFSGVRPTIPALATLAWDPRRATFFRTELLNALEILDRGDIDLARLRGSWAGAMGQTQFMPSAYLAYAQDFDGDGRRDIWSSPGDVFASIANYLKAHGWENGERWGREVRLPPAAARRVAADVARRNGTCQATRDMTVARPLAAWKALGLRLANGRPLPAASLDASLVSGGSRAFLVYRNYDALLEYNCAHAYAITVGLLADRIP
jgi:membrane-bound lytic murein transglycosylase B